MTEILIRLNETSIAGLAPETRNALMSLLRGSPQVTLSLKTKSHNTSRNDLPEASPERAGRWRYDLDLLGTKITKHTLGGILGV